MYMANVPALPAPTTPAFVLGPPVGATDRKTLFRVLDHRCHWLTDARQYSAIDGSSTSMRPVPLSDSGRRIATKADESGQLVANIRDWRAAGATGAHGAATQAPPVTTRMVLAGEVAMSLSTA